MKMLANLQQGRRYQTPTSRSLFWWSPIGKRTSHVLCMASLASKGLEQGKTSNRISRDPYTREMGVTQPRISPLGRGSGKLPSSSPRWNGGTKTEDVWHFLNKKRWEKGRTPDIYSTRKKIRERGTMTLHSPFLLGSTMVLSSSWSHSANLFWKPPPEKKTPTFEPFAGLTDPENHMATYKA